MSEFTFDYDVTAANWLNIVIAAVLIVLIIRSLFVIARVLLRRKR